MHSSILLGDFDEVLLYSNSIVNKNISSKIKRHPSTPKEQDQGKNTLHPLYSTVTLDWNE